MSQRLWYKLNGTDVSLNSSGTGKHLNNSGVTSYNDPIYGSVAYFDGNSHLSLPYSNISSEYPSAIYGTSSRSYSFWIKALNTGIIHCNGTDSSGKRWRVRKNTLDKLGIDFNNATATGTTSLTSTDWYHIITTYNSSTSEHSIYVNGVLDGTKTFTVNTGADTFDLGRDRNSTAAKFNGYMLDFRAAAGVYTTTQITDFYTNGPLNLHEPSITADMYTHIADLSWRYVHGASNYTVTQIEGGGSEETIVDASTELSHSLFDLPPNTSYVFNLYTDLNAVTPLVTTGATSTPVVNAAGVTSLLVRLSNDLTLLEEASIEEIESTLPDALSTGEVVTTDLGDLTFVGESDTIEVDEHHKKVLTPFHTTAGAGQTFDVITGPDTTSVTYDNTTDNVIVGSTTYSTGDVFIVGSYKVTVKDF